MFDKNDLNDRKNIYQLLQLGVLINDASIPETKKIIDKAIFKLNNLLKNDVIGQSEVSFCKCTKVYSVGIYEDGMMYCVGCKKYVKENDSL